MYDQTERFKFCPTCGNKGVEDNAVNWVEKEGIRNEWHRYGNLGGNYILFRIYLRIYDRSNKKEVWGKMKESKRKVGDIIDKEELSNGRICSFKQKWNCSFAWR